MPIQRFTIISKIGEIIAGVVDYRDGIRLASEYIAEALETDSCHLLLHDRRTDTLTLAAPFPGEEDLTSANIPAGEGIVGYCFRTGEPVKTSNKRNHREFRGTHLPGTEECFGLLALPLAVGGRRTGVMVLEQREESEISVATEETATAIASPLAIFLMNSDLAQKVAAAPEESREKSLIPHQILKGKPITSGVTRGRTHFLSGAEVLGSAPVTTTDDPEAEMKLFKAAMTLAKKEISDIREEAENILAEADAGIFYAHLLMLDDPVLSRRICDALEKGQTLASALKTVSREYEQELLRLDNEFMRERLADIKDVLLQIHQAMSELKEDQPDRQDTRETLSETDKTKRIIVAKELLPSQVIRIPLRNLAGIICERGGSTSHVAILAKALRIPMVIGVENAVEKIRPGNDVILDCTTGNCYVNPSSSILRKFLPALVHHQQRDLLKESPSSPGPAVTLDNVSVRLAGNISLISETAMLQEYGAQGIGLYRTEFMFMIRGAYPSEKEQYRVFRQVVESAGDSSVTIRVLDVGGDKPLPYVDFGKEDNPFLGWRGIRFLLSEPEYLERHLRAILRAAAHGQVDIMLPMVADVGELLQTKQILERSRKALESEGIPSGKNCRLGVMLEVPSAIWGLPDILEHIDFVSIGTNDLLQYTFAVDRGNSKVMKWYRQLHPIMLRVIKQVSDMINSAPGEKDLSVCGEIAGRPHAVPLLLGAGIRCLSMNPWRIPQVRKILTQLRADECTELLERCIGCTTEPEVSGLLRAFAEKRGIDLDIPE